MFSISVRKHCKEKKENSLLIIKRKFSLFIPSLHQRLMLVPLKAFSPPAGAFMVPFRVLSKEVFWCDGVSVVCCNMYLLGLRKIQATP